IVEGALTADMEKGCVWLDGYPVVWPSGTTATATPFSVHLPDGQLAHTGDHVRGGGGYFQPDSFSRTVAFAGLDVDRARDCLIGPTDEVAVLNNHGDITITKPAIAGPQPPEAALLSAAGRQRAIQASYCILDANNEGICADTPPWEPERYSIARPGETITIAVEASAIRYGGRVTIWNTERTRARQIQRLTSLETKVVLDVPPGLHTVDVFAPFSTSDGRTGTTSAVVGIAVVSDEKPRIVAAKQAAKLLGD
ncbi:MAG: hypothetical protein ACR2OD_05380, partial [Gaiellaceae bacterium]